MTEPGRVRALARPDVEELEELCREHAEYERAPWPQRERRRNLEVLLLDTEGNFCWVAEGDGELAGFASASLELSTWGAGHFLHLDCLYLRPQYRDRGLGRALLDPVARTALDLGALDLQWQTPVWNEDAIRFYRRLGAEPASKLRFTLDPEGCSNFLASRTSDAR